MTLTDTQRQLAEQLLISVIKKEPVIEYNELGRRINPPIFCRQVGKPIGEVSKLCHQLGLPLISAKVISKGQKIGGTGFQGLFTELGIDTEGKSERELYMQERQRIRECQEWYKLSDYLELDLDLPRPQQSTNWLIPCKTERFDIFNAFENSDELDWRQVANYQVGDFVYFYCTKPYQKIMFKTIVQRTDIPHDETIDDSKFCRDDFTSDDLGAAFFVRIKIEKFIDSDALLLETLQEHGLNAPPRGPMSINDELLAYIQAQFEGASVITRNAALTEEIDLEQGHTFPEGAKRQIVVNAYERNSLARGECIRIHGSICKICEFDFGLIYGDEFDGKIHVHHIKPLNEIDNNYMVNPKDDLVPVCPNCHMILHSKKGGVYSVAEVKEMINRNRKERNQ